MNQHSDELKQAECTKNWGSAVKVKVRGDGASGARQERIMNNVCDANVLNLERRGASKVKHKGASK